MMNIFPLLFHPQNWAEGMRFRDIAFISGSGMTCAAYPLDIQPLERWFHLGTWGQAQWNTVWNTVEWGKTRVERDGFYTRATWCSISLTRDGFGAFWTRLLFTSLKFRSHIVKINIHISQRCSQRSLFEGNHFFIITSWLPTLSFLGSPLKFEPT